jgi:hypothetical protein
MSMPAWAEGIKSLTNREYGFSLDYPDDWEVQLDENMIFSLAKLDEDMPVSFQILTMPESELELDGSYLKILENTLGMLPEDLNLQENELFEILDDSDYLLNGIPAKKLNLRLNLFDLVTWRMDNTFIQMDGKMICLSSSAEDSVFDKYTDKFDAIMKSFRLMNEKGKMPEPPR